MSYSDYKKGLAQLKSKPEKAKKFVKHNAPKPRKFGRSAYKCRRCGRIGAHIRRYNLHLCRQCFRETALYMGFRKFS